MAIPSAVHAVYAVYQNRDAIKRIVFWLCLIIASCFFFLYLVIATVFAVIQGNSTVSDGVDQPVLSFTEFQSFSYKTISGEKWFDFAHPYMFPTLGRLTQGVILDTEAKVGLRHIAWDIADRVPRTTEVRAFADGTVITVRDNMLWSTTRRWRFCDEAANGICWYVVREEADIQVGCGYEVLIQHADSLISQYCHLAAPTDLKVGDTVTVGQTIGYQGATGWATGKHLHFALKRDGQPIDPSYAFSQTRLDNWEEQQE